jgi:hypothetical protein
LRPKHTGRRRTRQEAKFQRENISSNLDHHETTISNKIYLAKNSSSNIIMSNRAVVQLRADSNEHRPEGAHTDTNSVDSDGCAR